MNTTIFRDRDWLFEQYITLGRTIKSIHEECGVSHNTIEAYLKKYDIRKTPKTPKLPTKDELIKLHHQRACGIGKIATMYPGVGVDTITQLMGRYGIEIIPPAKLRKMWWSNPDNQRTMSDIRLKLWQDDEYRDKTSAHLYDEQTIQQRSIKSSATHQGVDINEWNGLSLQNIPEQDKVQNISNGAKLSLNAMDISVNVAVIKAAKDTQ